MTLEEIEEKYKPKDTEQRADEEASKYEPTHTMEEAPDIMSILDDRVANNEDNPNAMDTTKEPTPIMDLLDRLGNLGEGNATAFVDNLEQEDTPVIDPELEQLKSDEGFRTKAYQDSRGNRTIGYGTAITSGRDIPDTVDEETATQWLTKDLSTARANAERLAPDAPKEVQNILTNMSYQMGSGGGSKFKETLALINKGLYEEAAEEMLDSEWAKQTPERAKRLSNRMKNIKIKGGNRNA
jgi:lysozyme